MKHTLPQLPYPYDALEPHIDGKTMEIHHTKHHQAYVNKLNEVLEKYSDLAEKNVAELLGSLDSLDMEDADKIALRNNGGGHLNHSLFWEIMGPEKKADHELVEEVQGAFGSLEKFKEEFSNAALTRFGSGWAWLVRDTDGAMKIYSTPNQDSPVMEGYTPIIGLDVWEHAYYLKYQNRRPDYISNWWNVLKLISSDR